MQNPPVQAACGRPWRESERGKPVAVVLEGERLRDAACSATFSTITQKVRKGGPRGGERWHVRTHAPFPTPWDAINRVPTDQPLT
jgi:hypothetical protein